MKKNLTLERLLKKGYKDTGLRYGENEKYLILENNKLRIIYDSQKDNIFIEYEMLRKENKIVIEFRKH